MNPCEGHPCDACQACQAGRCCGSEVGEPDLPRQGSWTEPVHGELGVLEERERKVRCHICGGWYVELGRHVAATHKVSADEYRAYFGLACGRALCPGWLSEQRSQRAKDHALGKDTTMFELTSEQRSLIAYKRESRLETAVKRREQLRAISAQGNAARWAEQRQRSDEPRIILKRHPKPEEAPGEQPGQ